MFIIFERHDPLLLPDKSSRPIEIDQMVLKQPHPVRKATIAQISIPWCMQVNQLVITRQPKMCNFLDFKDYKIVYKRYASLYFITIVDKDENELIIL